MNVSPPITAPLHAPLQRSATVCPPPRPVAVAWLAVVAGAMLLTQAGCTTLLTAGGLQEAFQDAGEPSAVAEYDAASEGEIRVDDDASEVSTTAEAKPIDPAAAEAALDAALERLAAAGRLTTATERALSAAVEDAPPQDWPDIIDTFVATIESTPAPQRLAMRPVEAPVAEPSPAPASEPTPHIAPVKATEATTPTASQPVSHLSVVNPCFASRVRGWGAVDRFDGSRFQPGQELIVYFELTNLTGDESPAGHTTRIDTTLQLCADDGRRLHEWRFEPIHETCPTPRRDYFARYVVRIPEGMPLGACRLDLAVTDTVAHTTAHASLPLEIADTVQ